MEIELTVRPYGEVKTIKKMTFDISDIKSVTGGLGCNCAMLNLKNGFSYKTNLYNHVLTKQLKALGWEG